MNTTPNSNAQESTHSQSAVKRTVLVVGANLGSLAALSVMLRAHVPVNTASTITSALSRLAFAPPALTVVFEQQLHHQELWCLLRALHVRSPTAPVLMLTTDDQAAIATPIPSQNLISLRPQFFELVPRVYAIWQLVAAKHVVSGKLGHSPGVSRAFEVLADCYPQAVTAAVIASRIGISRSHLAHCFRAEMGAGVRQCLTAIRLEVAKCLLLDTDMKLEAIAAQCGFVDGAHFSRVFTKFVGERPGLYRRRSSTF